MLSLGSPVRSSVVVPIVCNIGASLQSFLSVVLRAVEVATAQFLLVVLAGAAGVIGLALFSSLSRGGWAALSLSLVASVVFLSLIVQNFLGVALFPNPPTSG